MFTPLQIDKENIGNLINVSCILFEDNYYEQFLYRKGVKKMTEEHLGECFPPAFTEVVAVCHSPYTTAGFIFIKVCEVHP